MQIYDVNTGNYAPDWTSAAGKLIITPVVYANQTAIALTDSAITITCSMFASVKDFHMLLGKIATSVSMKFALVAPSQV